MNYKNHYDRLIDRAKNRIINVPTESHHIIPQCMTGSNDKINLVDLTPEEHLIAHLLLVKIYPNNQKLIYAAKWMTSRVKNNKEYGWLRRQHAELMRNREISDETRAKMSIAQKNRPKEVQDRITKAQQNRSPEVRKNMSDAQLGHIVSQETRDKISESNTGNKHSEETKKKMSESKTGEGNSFYGKTHTEETKKKMKEKRANQIITEETKRKIGIAHKGKIVSEETKNKLSVSHTGRTHTEEAKNKIKEKRKLQIITEETCKKKSDIFKRKREFNMLMLLSIMYYAGII
jgi:hypothetical protein